MTIATIVGVLLTIFGFGFLVKGLGSVFGLLTFSEVTSELDIISKLIESITNLVVALTKAPKWLASTIIGILLILLGGWIGGWLPHLT